MSSTVKVRLNVNGVEHDLEVEPRLLLVHAIRDNLGLTGTHVGCDTSNCGACTIHLNGEAVKSCTVLAVQADGAEITTIEGLGTEDNLHPMQEAFWANHGLQCGYCTPGMIMASSALLAENPNPTEDEVRHALEATCAAARATTTSSGGAGAASKSGSAGGGGMSVTEQAPSGGHVGRWMRRKEDPRLITGRARYIDDISLPGDAVGLVRPLAGGAREDRIDRQVRGRGPPRDPRRLHRRGHGRSRRSAADGLGASGRRRRQPRALAARARHSSTTSATRRRR